jgi:hypothetical protein
MRVFILEDDPTRMFWLHERLLGHEIVHAESCTQADRFQGPFDLVLLDHDLGGRQLEDHEDNGEAFANLISDQIGAAHVIIHSYNPAGAWRMARVFLNDAGIPVNVAPFRGVLFNKLLDAIERQHGPDTRLQDEGTAAHG